MSCFDAEGLYNEKQKKQWTSKSMASLSLFVLTDATISTTWLIA